MADGQAAPFDNGFSGRGGGSVADHRSPYPTALVARLRNERGASFPNSPTRFGSFAARFCASPLPALDAASARLGFFSEGNGRSFGPSNGADFDGRARVLGASWCHLYPAYHAGQFCCAVGMALVRRLSARRAAKPLPSDACRTPQQPFLSRPRFVPERTGTPLGISSLTSTDRQMVAADLLWFVGGNDTVSRHDP